MKKEDVINYFGSPSKTAKALKISRQAVSQWPEIIPPIMAHLVELVSKGELKDENI